MILKWFLRKFFTLSIVLITGILLSCEDSGNEKQIKTEANHTGCKSWAISGSENVKESEKDFIEYEYDLEGSLYIRHISAGFNCCIKKLFANILIDGNSIKITESEKLDGGGCDCLCLYDMEYKLNNIQPQLYTITILEPYALKSDTIISFSVDLSISKSGIIEQYRDTYPWGI